MLLTHTHTHSFLPFFFFSHSLDVILIKSVKRTAGKKERNKGKPIPGQYIRFGNGEKHRPFHYLHFIKSTDVILQEKYSTKYYTIWHSVSHSDRIILREGSEDGLKRNRKFSALLLSISLLLFSKTCYVLKFNGNIKF